MSTFRTVTMSVIGLIILVCHNCTAQKIELHRLLDTLYCSGRGWPIGDVVVQNVSDTVLDFEVKHKVAKCYNLTIIDSGRKDVSQLLRRKRYSVLLIRWRVIREDKKLVYVFSYAETDRRSYKRHMFHGWPEDDIAVSFARRPDSRNWFIQEIKYNR